MALGFFTALAGNDAVAWSGDPSLTERSARPPLQRWPNVASTSNSTATGKPSTACRQSSMGWALGYRDITEHRHARNVHVDLLDVLRQPREGRLKQCCLPRAKLADDLT
jgi:hypothetical protein